MRLIQVHFCFIYAAAGLSKLKGATWWNGEAFWEVMVNPEFTLMRYHYYESALRWFMSVKFVYHFMTATAVWGTLFIEIASPFLLWTRLRWLMIFLATAMHAVIGVLMGLNLFELLMIVMLLAFLPDRVIRDRFRGRKDLPRLTLGFNPQVGVQARAAALALAVDIDNQIALSPRLDGECRYADRCGKESRDWPRWRGVALQAGAAAGRSWPFCCGCPECAVWRPSISSHAMPRIAIPSQMSPRRACRPARG